MGCGYGSKYNPMTGTGAPTIQSLVPSSVPAGSPPFTLTVKGTGFASSSVVYWGTPATPRATTFVMGGNQLMAQITAADIANPATIPVYVLTSGGAYAGGVKSNTMDFTVTP